jgi:hypothetical protein
MSVSEGLGVNWSSKTRLTMSCKPGNINWLSIYLIFIQFVTLMFVIGLIVTSKVIFFYILHLNIA